MKPYPLLSLTHFTLPLCICLTLQHSGAVRSPLPPTRSSPCCTAHRMSHEWEHSPHLSPRCLDPPEKNAFVPSRAGRPSGGRRLPGRRARLACAFEEEIRDGSRGENQQVDDRLPEIE